LPGGFSNIPKNNFDFADIMKPYTKIVCLAVLMALLTVGSAGQDHVEVLMNLQTFGSARFDYRKRQVEYKDIKGSPYLTSDFQEGQLLMSNTLYKGLQLRYNVFADRFEVRLNQETIELDPVKNAVDTLYYSGYKFIRRFLQPEKNRALTYAAVIYSNGFCTLLKKFRISFTPATDAGAYEDAKPAQFSAIRSDFFLERGGEQSLVKGVKSIATFFNVEVKEVKSYIKSNRLKIGVDGDLARICAHFSEDATSAS
jgi:hypothetical protein